MRPTKLRGYCIFAAVALPAIFTSCQTTASVPEDPGVPAGMVESSLLPVSNPPQNEAALEQAAPDPVSTLPQDAPAEPAEAASPSSQAGDDPAAAVKPITVSTEVFNQTFSEVERLIFQLNDLIRKKDFNGWKSHLGTEYIATMSDPATLRDISNSPVLKRQGIVLKTLSDYFYSVVVPSRANIRLDDLVFLTETEVQAIMVVGNKRVTVYRLIKIGDQWIIGLS